MTAAPAESSVQLLAFGVGSARFALPASAVREVVRPPRTTRVPHAPESLVGLANLRGQVLPVVALGTLIGQGSTGSRRMIVLEQANPVGLLVDEVSEVVRESTGIALLDIDPLLAQAFEDGITRRPATRGGAAAAARHEEARRDDVTLLSFVVGGQDYALPITQVLEVTRLPQDITILPMSDSVALGSVAHDGRLLPLLSLRLLLGLPPGEAAPAPRVLIVRIGAQNVGLVVDAVQAMLRVAESAIDAVPAVLSRGTAEARIQAICRLDGGTRLVSVLATDHLVRAEMTGQQAHEAKSGGEEMDGDAGEAVTEQFLVFRLGEQDFAMPIAAVREVAALPGKLTRLPKAPAFVEGVMNLRGRPIPVIDQGRRFEGAATSGKRRRVIVTALGESEAGFLVDSVSEVLRVPLDALSPAPSLASEDTRVFDRVANLGDERIILIVEPQELLDRAERDLLAAMHGRDGMAAS